MIRNLSGLILRGGQWDGIVLGKNPNIYMGLHRNARKLQSMSVAVPPPTEEERYDATNNPNGIVNLGTGTNYLMHSEVSARITQLRTSQLGLGDSENLEETENETSRAVATFMTKFFKSSSTVQPHQIKVMNNVTSCIDLLGTFLGKPQDVLLCPAPGYSRLFKGCTQYSALEVVPVYLKHNPIINPNNPSGQVYSSQLILEIMELCQRYGIHVIISEVYCLSVFDENCKFTSVLQLGSKIPDPDKTHVLWGLTKDLCLTEFHAATVYSADSELMSKIQGNTLFSGVSLTDQRLLTMYINDHDWIENFYLVKNHERMRRAYLRAKMKLESLDIEVFPSQAGFFLFCNFRRVLNPATEQNCIEMFKLFNRNRVYVVPYWEMRCWQPGWFRIVFTAEDHIFDAGFERIKSAIEEWQKSRRQ